MNVTCPNCATVFRVDPAKVPEAGVRARCSVCGAVFGVQREGQPAAAGRGGSGVPLSRPLAPAPVRPPADASRPGGRRPSRTAGSDPQRASRAAGRRSSAAPRAEPPRPEPSAAGRARRSTAPEHPPRGHRRARHGRSRGGRASAARSRRHQPRHRCRPTPPRPPPGRLHRSPDARSIRSCPRTLPRRRGGWPARWSRTSWSITPPSGRRAFGTEPSRSSSRMRSGRVRRSTPSRSGAIWPSPPDTSERR